MTLVFDESQQESNGVAGTLYDVKRNLYCNPSTNANESKRKERIGKSLIQIRKSYIL